MRDDGCMPKINASTVAEHREHTYQALLDAVDSLILERGFDAVSMREVAKRAGVSRTVIYNYASDKMALLTASVLRTAQSLHSALLDAAADDGRPAPDRLKAVIETLLTFASSTHNLLMVRAAARSGSALEQGHVLMSSYQDELGEVMRSLIQQGVEAGDFAPAPDLTFTVDLITGVIDVALDRLKDEPEAADVITGTVIAFLLRALGRDKSTEQAGAGS